MFNIDPVAVLEEADPFRVDVRVAALQLVARWRSRDPKDVTF